MNEEELYRFNERLAILGVINRDQQPQERRMANEDVQAFREAIERQNNEHPNP